MIVGCPGMFQPLAWINVLLLPLFQYLLPEFRFFWVDLKQLLLLLHHLYTIVINNIIAIWIINWGYLSLYSRGLCLILFYGTLLILSILKIFLYKFPWESAYCTEESRALSPFAAALSET